MFLRNLEIKNYRSLADVSLPNLSNFNVLIGRNNSGKSSVFGSLMFLHDIVYARSVSWATAFTAQDTACPLEIHLQFDTRTQDRNRLLEIVGLSLDENRRTAMYNSPLFRRVEYNFVSAQIPLSLVLLSLRILAEDGRWATILSLRGNERSENVSFNSVNLWDSIAPGNIFESDVITGRLQNHSIETVINRHFMQHLTSNPEEPIRWLMWRLGKYLSDAFFFNPFRHSESRMRVEQTEKLEQNGRNLAQVLHTINSNNRPLFSKIETFIHDALPDIGVLQTPLYATDTEVSFRAAEGNYLTRLHDMGGGIEQLLMTAAVLLTTEEESSLFLEEPESHLHAGAQRFLIERLQQENRQVFITTHSPTFINAPRSKSLYQVKLAKNRTTITHLSEEVSLSEVLDDIGSRNSDVLLSDAVLFVEGSSDAQALNTWSEKLSKSFAESNITILPMEGGEGSGRKVRVRGDILEGISQRAPVPHLFILDRDERSRAEVEKLQGTLGTRVHLLERRELENYMLIPRALLAAVRDKHKDDSVIVEKVDAASVEEVQALIRVTAEGLKGMVLLKRIRAELGGLREGLLSRELVGELLSKASDEGFPKLLHEAITSRITRHLDGLNLEELISAEREALDKDWADPERHLYLAPGEEIISAVFHHFGSEYRKPKDTVRIARLMIKEEISPEFIEVSVQIASMTGTSPT